MSARNLDMSGKDIPQPVARALNRADDDAAADPVEQLHCDFWPTSLAVQMTATQYTTPSPNVDATIKTINGKVNELLSIAKAYGVSAVEGMSGSGNITLDVHATGPIKNTDAMRFSGSGALQSASLTMPALKQPINVRNANIEFTQNSMNMTNVAASLGSTNATGNLSMANFQAPRLTFALTADKMNVTELQKITGGSSPQKAPRQKRASGRIVEPHARLPMRRRRREPSMLQTATGNGTIAVGTLKYEQTVLRTCSRTSA